MKVAIASDTSVSCPDCQVEFEIDPELYGADVECPDCQCLFRIQPPPPKPAGDPPRTSSGIQIENPDEAKFAPMSTVRLTRDKATMDRLKGDLPKRTKEVKQMSEVDPKDDVVACPKCQSRFEIVPEFYGAIGECPDCNAEFLIKRPATSETDQDSFRSIRVRSTEGADLHTGGSASNVTKRPSGKSSTGDAPVGRRTGGPRGTSPAEPPQGVTTSGIEISARDELAPKQYHATATVRLSRNMSMEQQKSQKLAPPPPPERVAQLPEVHPVKGSVTCPGCSQSFEITTEYLGAVAECPDCNAEFLIAPPPPKAPAPKPPPATASTGSRRRPSAAPKAIGSTDKNEKPKEAEKTPATPPIAAPSQPASEASPKKKPPIGRKKPTLPEPPPDADSAPEEDEETGADAKGKLVIWIAVGLLGCALVAGIVWWLFFRG